MYYIKNEQTGKIKDDEFRFFKGVGSAFLLSAVFWVAVWGGVFYFTS